MNESEARNLLEERARTRFTIFADATGGQSAWEHLTERQRQGWRDVAAHVDEDCPSCGEPLVCVDCN